MHYINFPVSGLHGWGICGMSVAREMARLVPVTLLTDPFAINTIGDDLEDFALRRLLPEQAQAMKLAPMGGALSSPIRLDGPLLQGANKQFEPMIKGLRGTSTLGYAFFEDTDLPPNYVENAKHFDRIAAGSTWCAELLKRHGFANVSTVLQGVDPELFFPHEPARRFLHDHFVVFCGGKFEFRKGQDISIRAFKVLQDRHKEVMLMTACFNPWGFSFATMQQSKHIRFTVAPGADAMQGVSQILAGNGIDMSRALVLGLREHIRMPDLYRNSDVGLFFSRAEGGTNLVLMEYMACGKPAIATTSTGHADILTSDNCLGIGTQGEVVTSSDGTSKAVWPEPNLDEAIEKLEWAYQNRDALKAIGARGAETMKGRTWGQAARDFLSLM